MTGDTPCKMVGGRYCLSSHYAEDIGVLCDTVHEIDGGRVLEE